ncbi:GyrI-like domain-containing protein [Longispora sp. NPDC051575]|uniref:GyrI-like domain-containing protein n=1 Tax=Longispora sp. NPDC051575 TaxID=3154943 RepID=UPI003448FD5A
MTSAVAKVDLVRSDRGYFTATASPEVREFDTCIYAAVDGVGAPGGPEYVAALEALYPAAYGAKKRARAAGRDFTVSKLEGLWWVESDGPPLEVPREEWHWTLLIRLPEFVTPDLVTGGARFLRLTEGRAVQVLHTGPFATEPETLARMEEFMAARGLAHSGRHHEIYLTDPRRTAPERQRTILRQPVRAATT